MFLVDVSSISFKAGLIAGLLGGMLGLHMLYSLLFLFMAFRFIPNKRTPTRENPMPVFIAGIADPEERRKWDEAD